MNAEECAIMQNSPQKYFQKRFAGSVEQLYERQLEEKWAEREKHLAKGSQYCILG